MKKKIFIHVGSEKSGSSAIQFFMSQNRSELKKFGFYVPDRDLGFNDDLVTGNQVFYFQSLIDTQNLSDLISRLNIFFESIPDNGVALISSENLFSIKASFIIEALVNNFDLKFLAYIRRQDDYLISAWKQWYFRYEEDIYSWLLTATRDLGRWGAILNTYKNFISDDMLVLKIFNRAEFKFGNIVYDFIDFLNLSHCTEGFVVEELAVNKSLDIFIVDLFKSNPYYLLEAHDNNVIDKILHDFSFQNKYSPISFVARRKLEDLFSSENQIVCENFFPNREHLFPLVRFDDYLYPSPEESKNYQLKILFSMIMKIYEKIS